MYAIAGVSGHTGSATARALLARGEKVRVIVRDAKKGEPWRQQGAEVAVADLFDVKALTAAFTGAKGAWLLTPPDFTVKDVIASRQALVEGYAAAARAAKLPGLVMLSSVGAQLPSGTGPIAMVHRAEKLLEGAAGSVTFVRAAYFLENWGSVLGLAKEQGILPHYGPVDVKFSQVSTLDIGAVAAEALVAAKPGTRFIELAGKEDWSVQDVAGALGKLLGKTVNAVAAPVEAAHDGLKQAGVPEPMAGLYAEMYRGFASGKIGWEQPNALRRGSTPLPDALKLLLG